MAGLRTHLSDIVAVMDRECIRPEVIGMVGHETLLLTWFLAHPTRTVEAGNFVFGDLVAMTARQPRRRRRGLSDPAPTL
jgi:hypothetical protein